MSIVKLLDSVAIALFPSKTAKTSLPVLRKRSSTQGQIETFRDRLPKASVSFRPRAMTRSAWPRSVSNNHAVDLDVSTLLCRQLIQRPRYALDAIHVLLLARTK